MAFNRKIAAEVYAGYDDLRRRAESEAEARRAEAEEKIPGLRDVDRLLAMTGPRLMAVALKKSGETVEDVRLDVTRLRAEREALLTAGGFPADYPDVKYSCPVCSDTGTVDGRLCLCARRRIIEKELEASGISGLAGECSFDSFDLSYYSNDQAVYSNMKRVFEIVRGYAEDFSTGSPNLLFCGNTGLGKTHLAAALVGRVIDRGYDALYSGAVGLFADFESIRFRASTGVESGNDTERYFGSELLVIDDLGAEVTNSFTVSCLYDIMNRRRAAGLPTVITTNLNQRELGPRYTDRIVSRLFGDYLPLVFSGTDVRLQKLGRNNC